MEFLRNSTSKNTIWTRSAIHYSVDLDKISIGELEVYLASQKL